MTIQSPSLGAGLPTPPKPPTEGLQSRALSGTVSTPGKKETSGHTFRRGREIRAEQSLASSANASDLCHFSVRNTAFPREKTVTPPKTLPWTDKFCQIVRKLSSNDPRTPALVRRGSPDPPETADRRSPVPGTIRHHILRQGIWRPPVTRFGVVRDPRRTGTRTVKLR
jgi:hypothetical protein